jgi:predicted transcriptional regulator YdeE
MNPTIVKKEQIILLGFSFFGDPFAASAGWTEENEIGRLWSRFMTYLGQYGNCIQHVIGEQVAYEVHVETQETSQTGEWEIFVGMEVEKLEDVPTQLVAKILPPSTYAVFTFRGEHITFDWHTRIYREWMPDSGYTAAHRYSMQLYDERFKGLENLGESELDVYVPVKKSDGKL